MRILLNGSGALLNLLMAAALFMATGAAPAWYFAVAVVQGALIVADVDRTPATAPDQERVP